MIKKVRQKEIDEMLPIIVSDMLFKGMKPRQVTEKEVKKGLFIHFIRQMYRKKYFMHDEKLDEPAERIGCFIKGYVRDIWAYLGDAYRLVHNQSYTKKIKKILKYETNKKNVV